MNVVTIYNDCTYSRGSEEGTQASGEERFQGQEEEEVGASKQNSLMEIKVNFNRGNCVLS